jgi:hypothetical protein
MCVTANTTHNCDGSLISVPTTGVASTPVASSTASAAAEGLSLLVILIIAIGFALCLVAVGAFFIWYRRRGTGSESSMAEEERMEKLVAGVKKRVGDADELGEIEIQMQIGSGQFGT